MIRRRVLYPLVMMRRRASYPLGMIRRRVSYPLVMMRRVSYPLVIRRISHPLGIRRVSYPLGMIRRVSYSLVMMRRRVSYPLVMMRRGAKLQTDSPSEHKTVTVSFTITWVIFLHAASACIHVCMHALRTVSTDKHVTLYETLDHYYHPRGRKCHWAKTRKTQLWATSTEHPDALTYLLGVILGRTSYAVDSSTQQIQGSGIQQGKPAPTKPVSK